MKRTQIQIDEETHAALRRAAYEQGCSLSSLVRENLSKTYRRGRKGVPPQRTKFSFVGTARSRGGKRVPVSERHDEALEEALLERDTVLVLDEQAKAAARELADRYGCSVSEAIRRSIVRQRDGAAGISAGRLRERTVALRKLFELFEGNDPAAEVRRIKAEDEGS